MPSRLKKKEFVFSWRADLLIEAALVFSPHNSVSIVEVISRFPVVSFALTKEANLWPHFGTRSTSSNYCINLSEKRSIPQTGTDGRWTDGDPQPLPNSHLHLSQHAYWFATVMSSESMQKRWGLQSLKKKTKKESTLKLTARVGGGSGLVSAEMIIYMNSDPLWFSFVAFWGNEELQDLCICVDLKITRFLMEWNIILFFFYLTFI